MKRIMKGFVFALPLALLLLENGASFGTNGPAGAGTLGGTNSGGAKGGAAGIR